MLEYMHKNVTNLDVWQNPEHIFLIKDLQEVKKYFFWSLCQEYKNQELEHKLIARN